MNLHQLSCFIAVAREGHFRHAAESLHLSPPPVTRAVQELERQVGTRLLERRHDGVVLTRVGQELYDGMSVVLEELDRVWAAARSSARRDAREFRIGAVHLAPEGPLHTVLQAAREVLGPAADVHVEFGTSMTLLSDLAEGSLDVAVAHLPVDSRFRHELLQRYEFAAVLPSGEELASRSVLHLSDLADLTFVTGPRDNHPTAMTHLVHQVREAGVRRVEETAGADRALIASHLRFHGGFTVIVDPRTGGSTRAFTAPEFSIVPLAGPPLDFTLGLIWREGTGCDRERGDELARRVARMSASPGSGAAPEPQ